MAAQNKKLIEDWVSLVCIEAGGTRVEANGSAGAVVTTPWAGSTVVVLTGVQSGMNKLPVIKAVYRVLRGRQAAGGRQKLVEYTQAGQPQPLTTFSTYEKALEAVHQDCVGWGPESIWRRLADRRSRLPYVVVTDGQTVVVPAKPVNAVIDLKHAAALGQKVHGTSHGQRVLQHRYR